MKIFLTVPLLVNLREEGGGEDFEVRDSLVIDMTYPGEVGINLLMITSTDTNTFYSTQCCG